MEIETSVFIASFYPKKTKINWKRLFNRVSLLSGLCSWSAWVPQATNFWLWATDKTYFFHVSFNAGMGTQDFMVRSLWAPWNFSQTTALAFTSLGKILQLYSSGFATIQTIWISGFNLKNYP